MKILQLLFCLLALNIYCFSEETTKQNQQNSMIELTDTAPTSKDDFNKGLQFLLGSFDHPKDFKQAIYWFQKAAEQGSIDAQMQLGTMYRAGKGVDKDDKQAMFWFKKAFELLQDEAAHGNAISQYYLGNMYRDGLGVTQDYKQAITWLQKAAAQGYAPAQNNLADMYRNGQGVAQDYKNAMYWYQKAADQGFLNINGLDSPQDTNLASNLLKNVESQQNIFAQPRQSDIYNQKFDGPTTRSWNEKSAQREFDSAIEKFGIKFNPEHLDFLRPR